MKNAELSNAKVSKHPRGAFRAQKTLQKIRYSVLGHMGTSAASSAAIYKNGYNVKDSNKTENIFGEYIYIEKTKRKMRI